MLQFCTAYIFYKNVVQHIRKSAETLSYTHWIISKTPFKTQYRRKTPPLHSLSSWEWRVAIRTVLCKEAKSLYTSCLRAFAAQILVEVLSCVSHTHAWLLRKRLKKCLYILLELELGKTAQYIRLSNLFVCSKGRRTWFLTSLYSLLRQVLASSLFLC